MKSKILIWVMILFFLNGCTKNIYSIDDLIPSKNIGNIAIQYVLDYDQIIKKDAGANYGLGKDPFPWLGGQAIDARKFDYVDEDWLNSYRSKTSRMIAYPSVRISTFIIKCKNVQICLSKELEVYKNPYGFMFDNLNLSEPQKQFLKLSENQSSIYYNITEMNLNGQLIYRIYSPNSVAYVWIWNDYLFFNMNPIPEEQEIFAKSIAREIIRKYK